MTHLLKELQHMGLSTLDFSEHEQTFLDQFITVSAPFFDKISQHRPDKLSQDLILGLLTKSHHEALDNYQITEPKAAELKAMFSDQVGTEHAEKFTELSHDELIVISMLWFLTQGFTGIDYSYANDHALETAGLLDDEQQTEEAERYRTRFMQAYYTGIEVAKKQARQQADSSPFYVTLKKHLKRLFGNK
ncbi:hypothetical protein L4D08_12125 [Photobacterium chitinilyticum]|uniref:hypothetical protein n=1 Tax=Photobacterium chitinilyticum TaxID=2485123 RepID=UPI003D117431